MDLYTEAADRLLVLLLMGGIAGGLMNERTIHLALIKSDGTNFFDRKRSFVARDSVIMFLTLVASGIALVPALLEFGPYDIVDYLTALRGESGTLGWPLTVLVAANALAPFIVGIALMIGRRLRANDEWAYRRMMTSLD